MQSHLNNPFKVSVNISVVQLLENHFVEDLESMLARYNLSPQLLQLEITESVIIETHDLMINTLNAIRNLGIGLSLDDFGTGYSSLTYLQKLPINEIKIDKSFVDDMLSDSKPAKLVEAILYLAHSLNLKVVAEGVETEAQQSYLLSKGCTIMQGYYNSRPLPMEEVILYCEKQNDKT
jgi:EAL domain-containing protein (putative c-di-GMP-specific phosphodiesterase class I)